MRAIKQAGRLAVEDWLAERRKREVVTVGCTWCPWARTGTADVVLELQRAHVQGHPEYRRFDRKAHDRRIEREKSATVKRQRAELELVRKASRPKVVKPPRSRKAPHVARDCQNCGKPMPPAKKSDAIYCSKACGSKFHERLRIARRAEERLESRTGRTCGQCGGEIPTTRRAGALYCSKTCQEKTWHRRQRAA